MLNYIEMYHPHSVRFYERQIMECLCMYVLAIIVILVFIPMLNEYRNTVLSLFFFHSSCNSQVLPETSVTIPHFEQRVKFTTSLILGNLSPTPLSSNLSTASIRTSKHQVSENAVTTDVFLPFQQSQVFCM